MHPPPSEHPASDLLSELSDDVSEVLDQMPWAEDEIAHAMDRRPSHRDVLFHAFPLLIPTHRFMATEFFYRSHCRELLERVVQDADTRPATAVEVCCLCAHMSQEVPFNAAAAGLYFRMWAAAFPDRPLNTDRGHHHEALYKSRIDALEGEVRRRLRFDDRRSTNITCTGFHHGESTVCRFSPS